MAGGNKERGHLERLLRLPDPENRVDMTDPLSTNEFMARTSGPVADRSGPPLRGGEMMVEDPNFAADYKKSLAEMDKKSESAAPVMIPAKGTPFTKVTDYTSSAISGKQAKKLLERNQKSAEKFAKSIGQAQRHQDEIAFKASEIYDRTEAKFKELSDRIGEQSPALKKELELANKALKRSREELNNMEIDPYRMLKNMPKFARVLMMVDAFSSSGKGPRAQSVMNTVNKAIQFDLQAQRAQLAAKMDQLGIDAQRQRVAFNQLDAMQQRQARAAKSLADIQQARLATESNSVAASIDLAKALADNERRTASEESRISVLGKGRSTTRTVRNPEYQQAQIVAPGGDKEDLNKVKYDKQTVREISDGIVRANEMAEDPSLDKFIKLRKKYGGGLKGGAIQRGMEAFGVTEASKLAAVLRSMAMSIASALNGGKPSDADQRVIQASFPSSLSTDEALKVGLDTVYGKLYRTGKAKAKEHAAMGYTDQAKRLLKAAYKVRAKFKQMADSL